MKFEEILAEAAHLLTKSSISYALAGGVVGNLYRSEARLTQDIDFAVAVGLDRIDTVTKILSTLGLKVGEVRAGDLEQLPFRRSRATTTVQILVGRNADNPAQIGIDLLLTTLPWVETAVIRAQANRVKVLNDSYPALTVEDFIISKLYALKNQTRYKDLDDLEQVLDKNSALDISYLSGKMEALNLVIPKEIRQRVKIDSQLGKVARGIERRLKRS